MHTSHTTTIVIHPKYYTTNNTTQLRTTLHKETTFFFLHYLFLSPRLDDIKFPTNILTPTHVPPRHTTMHPASYLPLPTPCPQLVVSMTTHSHTHTKSYAPFFSFFLRARPPPPSPIFFFRAPLLFPQEVQPPQWLSHTPTFASYLLLELRSQILFVPFIYWLWIPPSKHFPSLFFLLSYQYTWYCQYQEESSCP